MTSIRRALLIVDVQNDFVEGGSLAVTGGRDVAAAIGEHVRRRSVTYDLLVASRDWHDSNSTNGGHFALDGAPDYTDTWPVHCVAETEGATFVPAIVEVLDHVDVVVSKGQNAPAYSAFQGTDNHGNNLHALLLSGGITHVDVCGIATDYCVKATALDALDRGFNVRLLPGLHAGVATETFSAAIGEMAGRGVEVSEGIFAP